MQSPFGWMAILFSRVAVRSGWRRAPRLIWSPHRDIDGHDPPPSADSAWTV